jgi:hypothetical protein
LSDNPSIENMSQSRIPKSATKHQNQPQNASANNPGSSSSSNNANNNPYYNAWGSKGMDPYLSIAVSAYNEANPGATITLKSLDDLDSDRMCRIMSCMIHFLENPDQDSFTPPPVITH